MRRIVLVLQGSLHTCNSFIIKGGICNPRGVRREQLGSSLSRVFGILWFKRSECLLQECKNTAVVGFCSSFQQRIREALRTP